MKKYLKNIKLFENFNKEVKDLKDFFENEDFNVYTFEQDDKKCAEIEKWTDGGVDMIITLMPFTKEEFIEYVKNFDIDEEIDIHRQDKLYKSHFTISDSLKDFTDFYNMLQDIAKKLEKL